MNRSVGIALAVVLIAIGILLDSSLFIVDQTETALVLQFGKPVRPVEQPGLEFKIPFVQNVVYFDKRLLDVEPPPEEVIASDQKRLVIDTYTRYRIVDPLLFYQTVGTEDGVRARLTALVSSSLRQVVGKAPLSALLSAQRADLMHLIRDDVRANAKSFGIDVVDTRIRRADLPTQNSEAIYARMNSERQQQAALYRGEGAQAAQTVRANADREVTVIVADAQRDAQQQRGDGDAAATAIYAKAYGQDKNFYAFYRSLEAYRTALAGHNTTFLLSPDSSFFQFFNNPAGSGATAAPANPPGSSPPSH
ncbi:MAG TPA: protease modulator HflC [Stellaceae bacterium]|jgi:membrane protease subunit HflC|nr:protease modulator HflC [Stellaceae bacterium]